VAGTDSDYAVATVTYWMRNFSGRFTARPKSLPPAVIIFKLQTRLQ
jgi:hypothetical protein